MDSTILDDERFDDPPPLLDGDALSTRRELLCKIMGLTIAAAAVGPKVASAEALEPPPPVDPSPMLFEFDTCDMRHLLARVFLEVDPAARTLRVVPRWEALANDPVPQPQPLRVVVKPSENPGRFGVHIFRWWDPEALPHCRLCVSCEAFPMLRPLADFHGVPELTDQLHCMKTVPLGAAIEDPALWSERGS